MCPVERRGRTIVVSKDRNPDPNQRRLTLPLPPSVNAYWKPVGQWGKNKKGTTVPVGRIILSKEGREYKANAEIIGRAQCRMGMLDGPVEVWLVVYFPNRRSDADNRTKPAFDSLQGVVIENDSQIDAYHVRREIDRENPRIEIQVRKL